MRDDLSHLLRKIREAEGEADAWPDALKSLATISDAAGAAFIVANKTSGVVEWVCFSGLSAQFEDAYLGYYATLDPYSPLLSVERGWTKLSDILSPTVLRKSEWYNDFVLSCGVRDILGARVVETPSHFATFGLHQRIGRSFDDRPKALMQAVSRPLAVAASRRIGSLAAAKYRERRSGAVVAGGTYYFHITNGKSYPDQTGQVFPSDREAVAHAAKIARELARDGDWGGFMIAVIDAVGRSVARVRVHT